MELRKISVNGVLYGTLYPKMSDQKAKNQDEMTMRRALAKLCDPCYLSENVSFIDTTIHQHITEGGLHGLRIREFFTLLAVCHTVFAEAADPAEPHKLLYKSQSPDEAALVSAAKDVGFAFLKRSDNFVTVNILGEIRNYEILKVIEFSSDRKRMSIIMRRPEGEIVLMCKGADSVIMERLHSKHDQYVKESTDVHLSDFANNGMLFT